MPSDWNPFWNEELFLRCSTLLSMIFLYPRWLLYVLNSKVNVEICRDIYLFKDMHFLFALLSHYASLSCPPLFPTIRLHSRSASTCCFWSSYIFLHYFLKRNPSLAAQGSSLGTTLLMSIRLSKMQKCPMSNFLAFGLVNVHFDDLYQCQLVHANAPRRNLSELYGILSTFILGSLCRLSAAFTSISSKTLYKAGT